MTERYLFGPGVVNGAVMTSILARTSSGGTTAWYLADKLGSVRDIVRTTGSELDHIVYDGFGNIVTETDAANGDRFKFAGMQYDATTGQYYDHARWYASSVGRFLILDPKGFAAGDTNIFRYVGNDPTAATDPGGEDGGITLLGLGLVGLGLLCAGGCSTTPPPLGPPLIVVHAPAGTTAFPQGTSYTAIQNNTNQILGNNLIGPQLSIINSGPTKQTGWIWNYNTNVWEFHLNLVYDFTPVKLEGTPPMSNPTGYSIQFNVAAYDRISQDEVKNATQLSLSLSNLLIHESIWHGVLWQIDQEGSPANSLPSTEGGSPTMPIGLTPNQVSQINKKFVYVPMPMPAPGEPGINQAHPNDPSKVGRFPHVRTATRAECGLALRRDK